MTPDHLLDFFHAQRFRNLLLDAHNGNSLAGEQLRDVVRLIAAYFLDLPLFLPEVGESLPTLFVWCELSQDALPTTTKRLNRADVSLALSPELGPKCPVIMLVYLGLPLEAILYSDHFADIRSGLILRIFADFCFGFSLTSDHIYYMLHEGIPEEIERLLVKPSTSTAGELEKYCRKAATAIMELDILLSTSRLMAFEIYLLGKAEFVFARLPVHSSSEFAKALPRPPIYAVPNALIGSPKKGQTDEVAAHWQAYAFVNLLLECLHSTNRLHYEVEQLRAILAQYDMQFKPNILSPRGAMRVVNSSTVSLRLLRLLILSLQFTYRDLFSQALAKDWADAQKLAKKYKALLVEEDKKTNEQLLESFFSLADEEDLAHINVFLRFIEERFPRRNTMPAYCSATREIWLEHLFEHEVDPHEREVDEGEWLRGHIRVENKVSQPVYTMLQYLATSWTTMPTTDRSLIAIPLHVSPKDLCAARPQHSPRLEPTHQVGGRSMSVDQPFSMMLTRPSTSAYNPQLAHKKDLISEYAERGVRLLGRGALPRDGLAGTVIAARKRLDDRVRRMVETQRDLEREVDSESSFLSQIGSLTERPRRFTRKSSFYTETVASPRNLEDCGRQIQVDLQALNKRLDKFAKLFHPRKSSSLDSAGISMAESKEADDEEPEAIFEYERPAGAEAEAELEDLDEDFPEADMEMLANALPHIEKLDFSQLSPPPTVGRRIVASPPKKLVPQLIDDGDDVESILTPPSTSFEQKGSASIRSARAQRKLGLMDTTDRILGSQPKPKKQLRKVESWMRLLPFPEGSTSEREFPLLRVDDSLLYRRSKTSRGVQTEKKTETRGEQINSRPDSGIDGSPSNLPKYPFAGAAGSGLVAD